MLAVGNANNIFMIGNNSPLSGGQRVYKFDRTTYGWDPVGSQGLTNISAGSDGALWGISNETTGGGYKIYQWNGSSWVNKTGGLAAIYVADSSYVYGMNDSGYVYQWNGSAWTQLAGITVANNNPQLVSVGTDGTIFASAYNSQRQQHVYEWTRGSWSDIGPIQYPYGLDAIFALAAGSIYQYVSDGTDQLLWHYQNGSWTQIPEAPNGGSYSLATQYVGKDGSMWSFCSDPNKGIEGASLIYQYVGGAWQAVTDCGALSLVQVSSDGTWFALGTSVFSGIKAALQWLETHLKRFGDCKAYSCDDLAVITKLIIAALLSVGAKMLGTPGMPPGLSILTAVAVISAIWVAYMLFKCGCKTFHPYW